MQLKAIVWPFIWQTDYPINFPKGLDNTLEAQRWNPLKKNLETSIHHSDGLVQERFNSTANAQELRLSCTNP